jgi:hypothetical protein
VELSSTLLGALTCETSVLATPVRGIPDIIIGGKTGFIMEITPRRASRQT